MIINKQPIVKLQAFLLKIISAEQVYEIINTY